MLHQPKAKQNYLNKLILICLFLAIACQSPEPAGKSLKSGVWRMEMHLNNANVLPFTFKLQQSGDQWVMDSEVI